MITTIKAITTFAATVRIRVLCDNHQDETIGKINDVLCDYKDDLQKDGEYVNHPAQSIGWWCARESSELNKSKPIHNSYFFSVSLEDVDPNRLMRRAQALQHVLDSWQLPDSIKHTSNGDEGI